MNDYRWDTKGLRTRLMVIFGNTTSMLTVVVPDRDKLIIENTNVVQALMADIDRHESDGKATLIEFLTHDDDLIEEARNWLADNDPEKQASFAIFHAFGSDPNNPANGWRVKNVVVVIPDEQTAVLFKLFFSGRGF